MTVNDVEQYAVRLEKKYAETSYKVLPENKIRIFRPGESAESYSKLAAENGIIITGMQTIQTSLENYYMDLKKRGDVK